MFRGLVEHDMFRGALERWTRCGLKLHGWFRCKNSVKFLHLLWLWGTATHSGLCVQLTFLQRDIHRENNITPQPLVSRSLLFQSLDRILFFNTLQNLSSLLPVG